MRGRVMDNGNSPVTKADLAAAVGEIKSYLRDELSSGEDRIKAHVREQVYEVETKLLRGFADYNTNSGIRFQKIEADLSNTDTASTKRLGGLESKIAELEMRLIRLETTYLPPPREHGRT
jgi:hypothetical protein